MLDTVMANTHSPFQFHFISTLQSQIILTAKLLLTNIFEIASSTNEIQYNPLVIEWYCYTLVHYVLKFVFVENTMLTVN